MTSIRQTAVAGSFYPDQANDLSDMIDEYLKPMNKDYHPKAFIVPHAGFIYSGSIAALSYSLLQRSHFQSVLLLGPSHRFSFEGIATSPDLYFETPLGKCSVDRELSQQIEMKFSFVRPIKKAHFQEHCLEVQLPFLQKTLIDFKFVPLLVGMSSDDDISSVLDFIWRENRLILVSSDLSHFLSYQEACKVDQQTIDNILFSQKEKIEFNHACGALPIRGLVKFAQKKGWKADVLEYKNSGDTSGDQARVVGYTSICYY